MGSSESTGRSNRTEEEEDEEARPENGSSGGRSWGARRAVAVVVVAAWGISTMLSGSTDTRTEGELTRPENGSSGGGSWGAGRAVAIAASGVAVVAWGISRMLSASTDTRSLEKDGEVAVKAPGIMEAFLINSGTSSHREYEKKDLSYPTPVSWSAPPPGRFKMNTDGGTISHGEHESRHISYRTLVSTSPPPPGLFKMNTDGGTCSHREHKSKHISYPTHVSRSPPPCLFKMNTGEHDSKHISYPTPVCRPPPPPSGFKMNTDDGTSSYREHKDKHMISYRTPVSRSPRPPGRFKMNTDGGARPNPGPSGYGGIVRNDRGKWVRGFRGFIGKSDCLTAEFHGIHKGLQLLDKLGLRGSILESDCEPATRWINQRDRTYPSRSQIIIDNWHIITECRRLIYENKITLNLISRDANKCADKLAQMAICNRKEYVNIKKLPDEIKQLLKADLGSW